MKYIKFLGVGILFGIVMTKSEIVSWYRIHEMFRFESFHMYGVIGSAVVLGALLIYLLKRFRANSYQGEPLQFKPKNETVTRYLVGGTIFGLGWAMTGACPGPMFVLLGKGVYSIGIVIVGATLGTFLYGLVRDRLPH